MTKKVFWDDPYQTELTSTVTNVDGNTIQLAETIFYAESGGQESDQGTIGGLDVLRAEKVGTAIIYTLSDTPPFVLGDSVTICVNWTRRYALMKLHFAAELVLELFSQKFPHIEKIGAHIGQDKSRIDFVWPTSINSLLDEMTAAAQRLIDADLPIQSAFSDEAQQRRYWRVEGFAQVPCGGTHLKRTSEVGRIRLKRKNIGKGKERVEITLVPSQ
ncbi:alanyl-tRNA editing protein [Vibrio proteolyticus]